MEDPRQRILLEYATKIATPYIHVLFAQTAAPNVVLTTELNILERERQLDAVAEDGYQLEGLVHICNLRVSHCFAPSCAELASSHGKRFWRLLS